ncbi:MAG TPA: hypothetical protein VHM30_10570 [Gemmatimonadaceae bacterium]|nr:hypothetical protein [Gemmatimonadaceae bacterium]
MRTSRLVLLALTGSALLAHSAAAQTGFYDLDAGRPVRVEDAMVIDRYALELEPLPLRAERIDAGGYRYLVEPHIAFGILPRTQIEIGAPFEYRDAPTRNQGGLVGLELSGMHSFNNERQHLPAFALWAGVRLPVGALASSSARVAFKGLMTRSFAVARLHLNAEYTSSSAKSVCQPVAGGTACSPYDDGHVCFRLTPIDASCATESVASPVVAATPVVGTTRGRWAAGLAADHAFPLRSLILVAGTFIQRDARRGAPLDWTAEAGLRWQLAPRTALDAGVGRHFSGSDRSWSLTTGLSYELSVARAGGR